LKEKLALFAESLWWFPEKVMFHCELIGVTTIDAFRAKLYSPISDALKSASIRVTGDDHEWVIDGIVPGVFTNILNLFLEANYDWNQVTKVHQRFESMFHESRTIPEIGDFPYATSEPIDNGGWVDGVQPCWTGASFFKDKDGKFVEWKKPLYSVKASGKGKAEVKPIMSRPSMSIYEDCFFCSNVWADGTPRRCEQAIADTMEAQVEACYQELKISKAYKPNTTESISWIVFQEEDNLDRHAPERVAKRQLNRINTKIGDVEFALDLFMDNGSSIALKKDKSKLNPNAVATALGSNIGESYKRGDKLTVKWAFKDLNKMKELLIREREIAEVKVKVFS